MESSNSTATITPIVQAQLSSLSDTDCYASSWEDALERAVSNNETFVKWGGRGQGGRGLSRRTFQPHDIIVENVRLEYVSDAASLPSKLLLDGAMLKLLAGHVYGLIGRNGVGKSSLLRRIHARKIPGVPTHITSVYIPQEGIPYQANKTPLEMAIGYYNTFLQDSMLVMKRRSDELEQELEQLDMSSEENEQRVEDICEEVASLEETMSDVTNPHERIKEATDALQFFGIDPESTTLLSGGQRLKVALACALFCRCDLLLLDEPNYLDIHGLLQLRRLIALCEKRKTTVLLTSHDVDLVNDVATDIIHFNNQKSLSYYPGNYHDFVYYKEQKDLHQGRQHYTMEKKREAMLVSLDNMKKQPIPKRSSKKGKAVDNIKKKIERVEMDLSKVGSDGPVDAPTRKTKHGKAPVDKAVQFVFRNTTCTWGEPLITAMDVYHTYSPASTSQSLPEATTTHCDSSSMLLECVDLCVDEGKRIIILGASASGKSTLLKLLGKIEEPTGGKIQHALNASVGLLDQHAAEKLMEFAKGDPCMTALSYLAKRFPQKSEQDLRAELKSFGLGPKQVSTSVQFLSGGERSRLCFASLMLEDPDVLLLDTPTSHLDVESVEALVQGLNEWNGTLVIASHDAYLIRSIEGAECFVILEGKRFRLRDGFDRYLRTFRL